MRSAMPAASQLPVRGPTDVDDVASSLHLHANQKSDYDMMTGNPLTLVTNEDPDEMLQNAAFHQSLHCLL